MGLRDKFKMSAKLETAGIQYEFDNARVTLARAGGANKKYTAAMEKVAREHGRAAQLDLLSDEKSATIIREVYADTVILNWETNVAAPGEEPDWKIGIEDVREDAEADAELRPFNKANVIDTLAILPDLFAELRAMAANLTVFRQSNLDDAVKN